MPIDRRSLRAGAWLALIAVCSLFAATAFAQRGPAPDPFVQEGITVKLAGHSYAIPDGNVGGVPNVGIVVGSLATLVIDPGLGRRNGEAVLREVAKVSQNTELYIATTHFHPEHTTGYLAFPASAKYINSKVQEAEFAESGMGMIRLFAGRSPGYASARQGGTVRGRRPNRACILCRT